MGPGGRIEDRHLEVTGMTTPNSPSASKPAGQAQTLPVQRFANEVIRGLLRTPLLSRAIGKRLLTLYFVGRKSHRPYAVPVAYTRYDGRLLVGSQFAWIRNLRSGEPIEIRLLGVRRPAEVRVVTDETGVVAHLATMCKDNHQFAKFNRIGLDHTGNPVPDDLRLAWTAGARVAELTPR
jgi:hypothetical protein